MLYWFSKVAISITYELEYDFSFLSFMKALYVEQIHKMNNGVCRMLQNGDLIENTVCGMIVLWTD